MDKPKVSPKDFFLWVMAMIALYSSVFALIALFFSYIDYSFPDALNRYIDPYGSAMRYQMAILFVMFPLFLVLMRFIRKDMVRDVTRQEIWIRRWALYFTVFAAGLTVVVDLITLINYFLGGDITMHFILKVLIVLLVTGAAFLHFLADIKGFWLKFPERARYVGWGAGAVVLATIVAGFLIMGTPGQIRLYRFDDQKISDLQNIQYQIVNYWQQKEKLPAAISDLYDPISNNYMPKDPQSGNEYSYSVTGQYSFKLCATFNLETNPNQADTVNGLSGPIAAPVGDKLAQNETWYHVAGEQCFSRGIDPQRYPPFPKTSGIPTPIPVKQ